MLRLAREYRYPVGTWIYDLPGGAANSGEDPADAARRDYEEETGLRPIDLVHLHTFYQNPSRSPTPIHLYFCRSVTAGTPIDDDPQEVVRTVEMSVSAFDELISTGEIVDPVLLISRLIAAQKGFLPGDLLKSQISASPTSPTSPTSPASPAWPAWPATSVSPAISVSPASPSVPRPVGSPAMPHRRPRPPNHRRY